MPRIKIVCVALVAMALVVAPSCGGGGEGFRVPASPLGISTTVLPALLSGDVVDVEIELTGGCGGPYVVQVISGGVNGGMPDGLGVENRVVPTPGLDGVLGTADDGTRNAAFLAGVLLEDGLFNFTVQVTDSA
ncbi:MAG: hypothetical protein QNJ98_05490, partial [Planctomycetota bacterium]|nr:hypothetical protein [Planctomycetota bacterium]